MAAEPFRPILVRGQSGGGKSALLANWVGGWSERHPGTATIVHHLGCGADAADPVRMVVRLMREISRLTGDEFKLESDPAKQLEELSQWLALASAWAQRSGCELILVLDGLDKVSPFAHLRWFPGFLPQGVKVVASCLDGEILAAARSRLDWTELEVEPFTTQEQITFIKRYLGRYRRELTEGQSRTPLAHPLSGNPLFLLTVLEELRVFGVHEKLSDRLKIMLSAPPGKAKGDAPTVDDVFEHVLARIEEDLGRKSVQAAMEAVWASRSGLTQDELLAITNLTPAQWAAMQNALDECLYEGGGRINFGHDYIRQAIKDRYLTSLHRIKIVHEKLGNYFYKLAQKQGADERIAHELPWQYLQASKPAHLAKALLIPKFLDIIYHNEGFYLILYRYAKETHSRDNSLQILRGVIRANELALRNGGVDLDKHMRRLLELFHYLQDRKRHSPKSWGDVIDVFSSEFTHCFGFFRSGYIDTGLFSAAFADQIVGIANLLLEDAKNLTDLQREWLSRISVTPVWPGE